MNARIGVAGRQSRIQRGREIEDVGAVIDDRIVETDAAGDAAAEVPRVLDVVDAGVGVVAADQERRGVARESLPGRRISRMRLAEGEAGELEEGVFHRDVATAGR